MRCFALLLTLVKDPPMKMRLFDCTTARTSEFACEVPATAEPFGSADAVAHVAAKQIAMNVVVKRPLISSPVSFSRGRKELEVLA